MAPSRFQLSPSRVCRGALAAAWVAAAAGALQASAEAPTPGRIDFEVLRGGAHFGDQGVEVTRTASGVVARTSADLRAGFGPLTLFHYTQNCRETWVGDTLSGLACSTLKNGKRTEVDVAPAENGLQVTAGKTSQTFPANALPTSWWRRPPPGQYEMINTETGEPLPVTVTRIGEETINIGGARIVADHVRVSGTLTVDLWYDADGHWVDCAFTASGQHMTYRLKSNPGEAPS
ncbi:MAG: hypothetical protein GC155_08190 [Alphaproteobacteria bacterium]|nr:hypothetical protein [Alphaproteobacteria bacterium]